MSDLQTFQAKKVKQNEFHRSSKGGLLAAYELFLLNGPEKRVREETYRSDLTLLFYNNKCKMNVKDELSAILLKLSNLKHWREAFIYDNTGAERRKIVLHIKNGVIETDLLNYQHWQMPNNTTKKQ